MPLPISDNQAATSDRNELQTKLDSLQEEGVLSRSHAFDSADEAAKAVLDVVAPLSKEHGLEIGGNIFLGEDGKHHYTIPQVGGPLSVEMNTSWPGYHTHPEGALLFSNTHFGGGRARDLHWVDRSGKALYLGVKQGGRVGIAVCRPGSCLDIGQRGSKGEVLQ